MYPSQQTSNDQKHQATLFMPTQLKRPRNAMSQVSRVTPRRAIKKEQDEQRSEGYAEKQEDAVEEEMDYASSLNYVPSRSDYHPSVPNDYKMLKERQEKQKEVERQELLRQGMQQLKQASKPSELPMRDIPIEAETGEEAYLRRMQMSCFK